jgi:hypothetical protein
MLACIALHACAGTLAVLLPDACDRRQHNGIAAFQIITRGVVNRNKYRFRHYIRSRVCALQDHQINEPKWDAWKVLPEAVRTGEVAFALAHGGLDMHEVGASCSITTHLRHLCPQALPLSSSTPLELTIDVTGAGPVA